MGRRKRETALLTAIEFFPGISGYTLGIITRIGVRKIYPDLARLQNQGLIIWRPHHNAEDFGGWYLIRRNYG